MRVLFTYNLYTVSSENTGIGPPTATYSVKTIHIKVWALSTWVSSLPWHSGIPRVDHVKFRYSDIITVFPVSGFLLKSTGITRYDRYTVGNPNSYLVIVDDKRTAGVPWTWPGPIRPHSADLGLGHLLLTLPNHRLLKYTDKHLDEHLLVIGCWHSLTTDY